MKIKYSKDQAINYFNKNLEKFKSAYSDSDFFKKIRNFSLKAGRHTVYNAFKLYYALKSEDVPLKEKIIVIAALGYFISPFDLVPDIVVTLGLVDDAAILGWAINRIHKHITPEIENRAIEQVNKILKTPT